MTNVQWAHFILVLVRTVGPVLAGAILGAGVIPPEWAGFISTLFGGSNGLS